MNHAPLYTTKSFQILEYIQSFCPHLYGGLTKTVSSSEYTKLAYHTLGSRTKHSLEKAPSNHLKTLRFRKHHFHLLKRATSLNNSTRTLMLVFSCWKARLSLSINCAKSLSETKHVKVYSASD